MGPPLQPTHPERAHAARCLVRAPACTGTLGPVDPLTWVCGLMFRDPVVRAGPQSTAAQVYRCSVSGDLSFLICGAENLLFHRTVGLPPSHILFLRVPFSGHLVWFQGLTKAGPSWSPVCRPLKDGREPHTSCCGCRMPTSPQCVHPTCADIWLARGGGYFLSCPMRTQQDSVT